MQLPQDDERKMFEASVARRKKHTRPSVTKEVNSPDEPLEVGKTGRGGPLKEKIAAVSLDKTTEEP